MQQSTFKQPMKKFVFRLDGSTAPGNMSIIYSHVKAKFPEAIKEEKKVGAFTYDCYISVYKENEIKAYKMLKGFASQTMHCN